MITFWIAAALLSAAIGALVLWRSARGAPAAHKPELQVYRRHLCELDELRAEGLLDDEGFRAARAEAARRLLKADATADVRPTREMDAPLARALVLGSCLAVAFVAAGLYLMVGSPGLPDEPFHARLIRWKASDPARLSAGEMAMWLKDEARRRPRDPQVLTWLAKAYLASGDPGEAMVALQRALALDPRQTEAWILLGDSRAALADGRVGPDAEAAYRAALSLDPNAQAALLDLAEGAYAAGRGQEAATYLTRLANTFPASDPRRAAVLSRVAAIASGQDREATTIASTPPDQQGRMIRGMVEGLAARLARTPDDPAGWARLVRAYRVLGDKPKLAAALTQARRQFRNRPAELAGIEAAAR